MRHFINKWINILKKNLRNKSWWGYLLIRIYSRFFGNFYKLRTTKVINREWDVLIILDACRYDLLKEYIPSKYKDKVNYIYSTGSCTPEFLKRTFSNVKLDIIYITANPYVNLLVPNSFYKIIPVWKIAWSDEYGTVLPKNMVNISKIVFNNNKHKKLIIHFMQPHYPFITNLEIRGTFTALKLAAEKKDINKLKEDINPWKLLMK